MKRNHLLISTCLLFISLTGFGQGALIWHFGDKARLDFTTSTPGATCGSEIQSTYVCGPNAGLTLGVEEGTAGVTTTNGLDLFYTNGVSVWDRSGTIMPGANKNMLGGSSSVTSALIVPSPADSNQFYIFTVDAVSQHDYEDNDPGAACSLGANQQTNGISYSIIDISLPGNGTAANPLGDMVPGQLNNSFLPNNNQERLTSIPKADGSGYWLVTVNGANQGVPIIEVYELTASGITGGGTPTVINSFNLNSIGIYWGSLQGSIKSSPSGTQVALPIGANLVIMDFNQNTGFLSNVQKINTVLYNFAYGVEFSPNEDVLYATSLVDAKLYKYNLAAANISSTETLVATGTGEFGNIQMGPDGIIYGAYSAPGGNRQANLYGITDPDNFTNPAFQDPQVTFPCNAVLLGLPTFVPALVNNIQCTPPSVPTITGNLDFCNGQSTTLIASYEPTYNYYWIDDATGDTLEWGFEDTTFVATESGTYHVLLASPLNLNDLSCSSQSNPVTVTEHPTPVVAGPISGTDPVCRGGGVEAYTLQNDPGYSSYTWTANNGANITSAQDLNTISINFSAVSANSVTIGLTVEEVLGSATCESAQFTQVISIEELPTFTVEDANVSCNSTGNTVAITGATGTISTSSVSSGITITGETTSEITFSVTDVATGSFDVIETSANDCASEPVTVDVTVLGCGLEAIIDVSSSSCADSVVTFDGTSSNSGNGTAITSYSWVFPSEVTIVGQTAVSGIDSARVMATISNSGTTPLDITATLIVTNDAPTTMTDDTIHVGAITINPNPGAVDIDATGVVCQGEQAIYTVTPYVASSDYVWTSSPVSNTVDTDSSISVTNGTADYVVTVREQNQYGCYGVADSLEVTVEETPIVVQDTYTASCNSTGNVFNIPNFDAANIYSVSSQPAGYTVVVVGDEVQFDVTSDPGTIVIQQETPNGCVNNMLSLSVTVQGCGLNASFTVSSDSCASDTLTFRSTSDPGAGVDIDKYSWIFPSELTIVDQTPDGRGVDSFIVRAVFNVTTPTPITVTHSITTSAPLSDTVTRVDVITLVPLPDDIEIVSSGKICEDSVLVFNVITSNPSSDYSWSSTNASFSSTDDQGQATNGTSNYEVRVTETNEYGCVGAEDTLTVEVESTPVFSLSPNPLSVTCDSDEGYFLIEDTFRGTSDYFPVITSGDAVVSGQSGDTLFIDAGVDPLSTLTVYETTVNGCESEIYNADIEVIGCEITAVITSNDPDVCDGEVITLSAENSVSVGTPIVGYDWIFTPDTQVEVIGADDEETIQIRLTNSGVTPDSIQVTLVVENSAGITDTTVRSNYVVALPSPVLTGIAEAGGTCPGDTSSFSPSPFNSAVSYSWAHTASSVIVTEDDSLYRLVNSTVDDTITVIANLFGCTATETIIRDITDLPSNISGIFGNTDVCSIASSDSVQRYSITADNADVINWYSVPAFGTSVQPVSAQGETFIDLLFTDFNVDVELFVEISNSNCAESAKTVLDLSIFVDTFYTPNPSINNPQVCEEDNNQYVIDLDYLGSSPSEIPNLTWFLNGDTLFNEINDTLVIENLMDGDSIGVALAYSNTCLRHDAPIEFGWLLNTVTRPGGTLLINGDSIEHTLSGIYSIPQITLTDTLETKRLALGWDSPESWQWMWYDAENDTLISDGIPFPTTVNHTSQATPPTYDENAYSVEYYMVTYNGVCYDTSIAILNIDFDIFIPDAFSPNNDNSHETWEITNLEKYPGAKALIYNRWGNLVAELDDIATNPWDGKRDGKELPMGTYFYLLTVEEGTEAIPGDVSILR